MKKFLRIGIGIAMLSIIIFGIALAGMTITEAKKPTPIPTPTTTPTPTPTPSPTPISTTGKKLTDDRINSRDNPYPVNNSKVPISGIMQFAFTYPEVFRTGTAPTINNIVSNIQPLVPFNIIFNKEIGNLEQNEESVTAYGSIVVGGANDYRGIPLFNQMLGVSGYYVSNNGGSTIWREGALPPLTNVTDDYSRRFGARSWGDPVLDSDSSTGSIYYGSLYIDDNTGTSAIGLAKSTPSKLTDLSLTDSQIWQVTKVRATNDGWSPYLEYHFNDKEWIAVDNSGSAYKGNIFVTWTDFGSGGSKILMSRCEPNSLTCTPLNDYINNPVSEYQYNTQWSKVSIDSAGRVIVTWTEYVYGNTNAPYYKINLWYKVFDVGGTSVLKPATLITTLDKPVSYSYALQGNEFRVPAGLWNEPATVGSTPRLFVAYFDCRGGKYLYDFPQWGYADTCSNSDLYMKYIDNYQTSSPTISSDISVETDTTVHGFFPTLSVNQPNGLLDLAWYQTEGWYKHDIYVARQQRSISTPTTVTQSTSTIYASDPDADAFNYGNFIGDYFQTKTIPGSPSTSYTHYNANWRYTDPAPYWYNTNTLWNIGGNQQDNALYTTTY